MVRIRFLLLQWNFWPCSRVLVYALAYKYYLFLFKRTRGPMNKGSTTHHGLFMDVLVTLLS